MSKWCYPLSEKKENILLELKLIITFGPILIIGTLLKGNLHYKNVSIIRTGESNLQASTQPRWNAMN